MHEDKNSPGSFYAIADDRKPPELVDLSAVIDRSHATSESSSRKVVAASDHEHHTGVDKIDSGSLIKEKGKKTATTSAPTSVSSLFGDIKSLLFGTEESKNVTGVL